jgi:membrane associated rhomboid family serine protease
MQELPEPGTNVAPPQPVRLGGARTVTIAITVLCVALAALGYFWSDGAYGMSLFRMGADTRASLRGEPYRLLASAFLHASPIHLGMNMLALWSFGPLLEAVLGRARYLLLYTASALGGSLLSMTLGPDRMSVGASGAIWGLMAGGIALAYFPRGVLPEIATARLRQRAWPPLVMNLIFSFTPGVDYLAHLGGGITGALLVAGVLTRGLTPVVQRAGDRDVERVPNKAIAAAAIVAGVLMIGSVAAALINGKPWELREPLTFKPTSLAPAHLTIDLPDELARHHEEETRASGTRIVTFGEAGNSPLLIEVVIIDLGQPLPNEAVDAATDNIVNAFTTSIPKGLTLQSKPERVMLGERSAAFATFKTENDVMVKAWGRMLPNGATTYEVIVRSYDLGERPRAWSNIEGSVAASVKVP